MTNHAQTVVYTIYMNKLYRLVTTFVLSTLAFGVADSWAQPPAPNDPAKAPKESNKEEPAIQKDGPPQRVHGGMKRSMSPANQTHAMQVLAKQLSGDATEWIDTDDESFFAIWQEDRSGDAKGAVLIIHAEGEHPSWPQTTKPLHDTLPEYGWATMAISLPNPSQKETPKRTIPVKTIGNTTEKGSTEEPVSTKEPLQNSIEKDKAKAPAEKTAKDNQITEKTTEKRLISSLNFLHDRGQFNIVLMGSGIGGIRSHAFIKSITPIITDKKLKDKIEKPVRALILYNARNTLPNNNETYKDWFSDPDIPILDIFTTVDGRNEQEAKKRQVLSKRKKAAFYSKVKLAEMSYEKSWGENRLSRRIRSFLDTYVKGVEIENGRLQKNK